MTYEDFTTYNETDPNNELTVTTTKVTAATYVQTADARVSDDKGANHFGDFEHLVNGKVTASSANAQFGIWAIGDTLGCIEDWLASNDAAALYFSHVGASRVIYIVAFDNGDNLDSSAYSDDTDYYFKVTRSGTTLTTYIYSDAAQTNLLDTIACTMSSASYRYIETAFNRNNATWTGDHSGFIENLDIKEAPATITTGSASNIAQTTVTLGGNLTDLGDDPTIDVSFEYGETAAYGSETTPEEKIATGAFTQDETGLTANTGYHFRAKAVSAYGTTYGSDAEFTTLSAAVAKRRKGFMYGMKPAKITKVGGVGI